MNKPQRMTTRVAAIATSVIALVGTVAIPAQAVPAAKCYYTATSGTCYQVVTTTKSTFKALSTDALINNTSKTATLTCHVDTSSTLTASATVTVSGSVKIALVAQMDASVSATVTGSVTTSVGSSVSVSVPPHTTTLCDRGTYKYVGHVKKTGFNGQHTLPTTYFDVTAPSTLAWRLREQ